MLFSLDRRLEPPEEGDKTPICPECGGECERFYMLRATNEIIGCECCIDWENSWEVDPKLWEDDF